MNIVNIEELEQHVLQSYPMEACGYILDEVYIPCENISSSPTETFEFSQADSFVIATKDVAVIHSHTAEKYTGDPRIPSYEDMITQNNCQKQFGIVHCDGESVSQILWFGKPSAEPLEGRKYIPNVYDCFTIVRDYYFKEYSVDLGSHPRPANWEEWNAHYIEQTYEKLGFSKVNIAKIASGDVVLMSLGSRHINHVGIYLGEDIFLHHLRDRKSATDSVTKWSKHITCVLRKTIW